MCYKMGITAVIILLLITKRLMGQASNEPLLYRIYGCIDVDLLTNSGIYRSFQFYLICNVIL